MKRMAFLMLPILLLANAAQATTDSFINRGFWGYIYPPGSATANNPTIDATNLINYGVMTATNLLFTGLNPADPYQPANVQNYTNYGSMFGDPGWQFNYFMQPNPVTSPNPLHPAKNFYNGVSISDSNTTIYGVSWLNIWASNIVNRGLLTMSPIGSMTVSGHNVDLTRSFLGGVGAETNGAAGFQAHYWGVNTGALLAAFSPAFVAVGSQNNTVIDGVFQIPGQTVIDRLTNGFNVYQTVSLIGTQILVEALILGNTDPRVRTEVRFSQPAGTTKAVLWSTVSTNPVTLQVSTNLVSFQDTGWSEVIGPQLVYSPIAIPTYQAFFATNFIPLNYEFARDFPRLWDLLFDKAAETTGLDPILYGTDATMMTNTSYGIKVLSSAFQPDPTYAGITTFSNVPGKLEIIASNSLDMTRVRIDGESFFRVHATNHFVGSTNASIVAPFSEIYLASTNRSLTIGNLTTPTVPRMQGTIDCWTGHWTNATGYGSEILHVTVVDPRLSTDISALITKLKLKADDLVIQDVMNIQETALLDCNTLTVATNAPGAPTTRGELNFILDGEPAWSTNFPRVMNVTNYGAITASNAAYFAHSVVKPHAGGEFTGPFETFVNRGLVLTMGNTTWARYFENQGGVLDGGLGPITVTADMGSFGGGWVVATNNDIALNAYGLSISNETVKAGRRIILNATNYLDDGSLLTPVDVMTNRNFWTTGGGLSLLRRPEQSSLLGTTITNQAFVNAPVPIVWGAADQGDSPAGFVNNAAVGRMVMDARPGGLFSFAGPDSTGSYAMYIDRMELSDYATNRNDNGDFNALDVAPNMKVYYGQAVAADGTDLSQKLNGRSDGRFVWVENYNSGYFSSIFVTNPATGLGTRINEALYTAGNLGVDPFAEYAPPTLDAITNRTVLKDAAIQTVALTGIGAGTDNPTDGIVLSAISSNPGLISAVTIDYTSPQSTGTLSFKPAAGRTGTAEITVTVANSQVLNNTATQTFMVTVNAPGETLPPTLDPIADQTVARNSLTQTVPLTGITAGAGNPAAGVTVSASSGNPEVIPAVAVDYTEPATTGTLSFTPATGQTGTAVITVTVSNGLALNNAYTQSFTVTVSSSPSVTGAPQIEYPGGGTTGPTNGSVSFAAAKGAYTGLFCHTNGVTVAGSGWITALVTDRGTYSGKMKQGSRTYAFSGAFNGQGHATNSVKLLRGSTGSLILKVDTSGAGQLTGQFMTPGWTADVIADKLAYSNARRTSNAGLWNFVVPPGEDNGPGGYGLGSAKVAPTGRVTIKGTLADGTKISAASIVSTNGIIPLYAAPYRGAGVVVSWILLEKPDLSGNFVWIKPAGVPPGYPRGFTNGVDLVGGLYTAPSAGQAAADTLLWLSGGSLSQPYSEPVTLNPRGRSNGAGSNKLSVTVNPSQGTFRGTLKHPETSAPLKFQGVLLGRDEGAGYFLDGGLSGAVTIAPQ